MNRREAISRVSWLLGGTIVGVNIFLEIDHKLTLEKIEALSNQKNIDLLNEIGETILPATATPGAKDAKVGEFMAIMVNDCYWPRDQDTFIQGVDMLNLTCKKKYSKEFMQLDTKQRTEILTILDAEQKIYTKNRKPNDTYHYFRMMKELTLLSFFTSEMGCTKALRYVAVPGRYDGSLPYKKGDRAWAS